MSIQVKDVFWAAGFLEGEGYFGCDKTKSLLRVSSNQVQREPLARLQELFGGSITLSERKQYSPNASAIFTWQVVGVKGAGVCMMLFSLMSPRRKEQIQEALTRWKSHGAAHKHRAFCKQGHPYTPENTYIRPGRKGRKCRTCIHNRSAGYTRAHRARLAAKKCSKFRTFRGVDSTTG